MAGGVGGDDGSGRDWVEISVAFQLDKSESGKEEEGGKGAHTQVVEYSYIDAFHCEFIHIPRGCHPHHWVPNEYFVSEENSIHVQRPRY